MSTVHPRINVVVNEEILSSLNFVAKREHKSLSSLARELIEDALDRREDKLLSEFAIKREAKSEEIFSHEDAWEENLD